MALTFKYGMQGDDKDLEERIELNREALSLVSDLSPSTRVIALNNLAVSGFVLFEQRKEYHDLDECISLARQGLRDASVNHQVYYVLSTLANALFSRFVRRGDSQDLEDCILTSRRMFKVLPDSNIEHASSLCSPARSLAKLYETTQELKHLRCTSKILGNLQQTLSPKNLRMLLAIVFLSTARSVFWSQALQLRTSLGQLELSHPSLAKELQSTSHQLEAASYKTVERGNTYSLSQKREETLKAVWELDGFHDFLLPQLFASLKEAAHDGPIIFLNANDDGYNAIILRPGGGLQHVPLPLMWSAVLRLLRVEVRNLSHGRVCTPWVRAPHSQDARP
ncbi:hypothetical protein FA15DRAFT_705970 [Coprinopsis marcescibilis]|uniref:Uncharacterized protein n=1 Tax=Coprinopsis marcescibilis TaxID=230819 RepID=A0A5C3KR59_COPMA|nr:hypothetical protein FA15DRAFT_705970 [Coprinopsis marcescibilis]